MAPCLRAVIGVGPLIAAKIVAEVADIRPPQRHRSTARLAWEPEPAPSLAHWQPVTQRHHPPHRHHPDARAFRDRRVTMGDTATEALRAIERRLSDAVYRAHLTNADIAPPSRLDQAA